MTKQQKSALCTFVCFVGYVLCVLAGLVFSHAHGQQITWQSGSGDDRLQYYQDCPGGVCPEPGVVGRVVRNILGGATREAYDLQIEVHDGRGVAQGSGIACARVAGGTLVVTNHHVIEGGRQVYVISPQGRHAAQVVADDAQNDAAILRVDVVLPFVNVAATVPSGVDAQFRAFDGGRHFVAWRGRIVGYSHDSYIANTYAVGGNSGGGVFVGNQLVGVMWGNRDNRLAFCGVGPIRRLLTRVLGNCPPPSSPVIVVPPPADPSADPGPAPDEPPQQPTPAPDLSGIEAKIDAYIAGRLAELKGPAGERGPAGKDGRDGKDAAPVDLDALAARIEAAVIAKLEASRPADDGAQDAHQADGRVLYFTSSKGCAACAEITQRIEELKAKGAPITIVDLDPANYSVKGVPRMYYPSTGRTIEGLSNVRVHLATLTW